MADICKTKLCIILGHQQFNLNRDEQKLAEKLKSPSILRHILNDFKDVNKRGKKGRKNHFITFNLSQGVTTNSANKAAELLLERELPEVYKDQDGFGAKFYPEGYIPSQSRLFDHKSIERFDEETRQFYQDDIFQLRGDITERRCYESLKDHFSKSKDDLVIVQGAEMINLDLPTTHNEADFILINKSRKYLMNIEVKTYLGPWDKKTKNPLEKAKEQLESNKKILENWFGSDIRSKWHYFALIFGKSIHDDIQRHQRSCDICNDFIVQSSEDLENTLFIIEEILPRLQVFTEDDKQDFKTFIKYLLFLMPRNSLPIGANFTKKMRKAIEKAGSVENIKMIAFPTNEQRLILSIPKAFLIAPWGAGKTWLMLAKAIELSLQGHKIVFAIFTFLETLHNDPLLLIDLEAKVQEYENIEIVLISGLNMQKLYEVTKNVKYFFGDEFIDNLNVFADEAKNEIINFLNSMEFCWITVSNSLLAKEDCHLDKDLKSYVETWKPKDYGFIELKTSCRTSQKVILELKKTLNPRKYNHELMMKSQIPPNLTEGSDVIHIGNYESSPKKAIKKCFDFVNSKDVEKGVLIIIDDHVNDSYKNLIHCQCNEKICAIALDILLEQEGRNSPLFHLRKFSSGKEKVKQWLMDPKGKQDLIVDRSLTKGFEYDFVVNLSKDNQFISRSSGHVVDLKFDFGSIKTALINAIIFNEEHDCEKILARNARNLRTVLINLN